MKVNIPPNFSSARNQDDEDHKQGTLFASQTLTNFWSKEPSDLENLA
jgi:hypothetical protein